MAQDTCSIEGCERLVKTRGWCGAHYKRWKRHGDPLGGRKPPENPYNGALCSVEGCNEPAVKRTWCSTHYRRWKLYGNPRPSIAIRHPGATFYDPPQKPFKPIGTHDAAWLAGLFEGEGTIIIRSKYVRLVINMTDRDVIERVDSLVPTPNGPILRPRAKAHHKDQYTWQAARADIVKSLLLAMLPWFGARRRSRALAALFVIDHLHPGGHGHAQRAKTHCPKGHPYDEANTYVNDRGQRSCKICTRERVKRWEEAHALKRADSD